MTDAIPSRLFNYTDTKKEVGGLVSKTRAVIHPHNQSGNSILTQEQLFQFYLPSGRPGTYLNHEAKPYITFDLVIAKNSGDTNATSFTLDHSAYSFLR